MNRNAKFFLTALLLALFGFINGSNLKAQNAFDSLTEQAKLKILRNVNHFTFRFYVDSYYNMTFGGETDTSNVVPFSSNCPVHDQIRMNVAALELYYESSSVRGKLALQYGDAPNLLADPEVNFIKNLRQANFGFRLWKELWIDFGYMFNPVGYESSWTVLNRISTVTIGGYFEPGSVLGTKLSYKFSEKFNMGLMIGNPYSLAYGKNTHMAGMIFLNYKPMDKLQFTYNNFFGNQALKTAKLKNDILYNNLIVTYLPFKGFELVGQVDLAAQTNSGRWPDTTKTAYMYSGFLQCSYAFERHLRGSVKYELFHDPDGFLSGVYSFDGKVHGLLTHGLTLGFEYKPIEIGFMRLEYRYLFANPGNKVFYSNTSDELQSLIFTTGVRF